VKEGLKLSIWPSNTNLGWTNKQTLLSFSGIPIRTYRQCIDSQIYCHTG